MTTGYVKWRTVTLEGTYQWNFSRINLEYLLNILINGFGTKCRTGPVEFGGGKILWGIINIKDDQNITQKKYSDLEDYSNRNKMKFKSTGGT